MMCIIGRKLNVFFMVPIYFWWRKFKGEGGNMAVFELILCIIAAVVVSSFVSRFVPKVSTPLVQIVLGVLVTYLPFFPDATLDPELFMVLFIAPLLYWKPTKSISRRC